MNEAIVYFILGLAVASLFFIILVPILLRRMRNKVRRIAEARTPHSLRTVELNRDFLRAEQAVTLTRLQQKYDNLLIEYAAQKMSFDQDKEKILKFESAAEKARKAAENAVPNDVLALKTMEQKIKHLKNSQVSHQDLAELREQIIDFAAIVCSSAILNVGKKSLAYASIKKVKNGFGLAGRIKQELKNSGL